MILWDGGNNDTPFVQPDVHIVVVDPHRPGHELRYHPGETNLRMADVCVVNKIDSAPQEGIDAVLDSIHEHNPNATVVLAASPFHVEGDASEIRGKRVLAIEDGPTLTHGEMTYGAAVLAAKQHGAAELVDPRPFAVGTIAKTFEDYPHVGTLLPAMGYGDEQIEDLRKTIDALRRRARPDRHADRPAQARRLRPARASRDVSAPGGRRADARRRARREGPARAGSRVSATVVALGGNALVREGERGTVAEQRANLREHCAALVPLLDGPLVVTHGNGPQVGAALLRSERAADEAPPLPLWLAVAQTQAEIGSLIGLELGALVARPVATVVTHVRVDEDDPAFAEPTKPIGPFYSREQAERLEQERGWRLVEDAGRGWRRVVPSPQPRTIVELEAVRRLLDDGIVAVACGGGGIPVVERSGRLDGVDAVIDKDLTSALLAAELGARRLVIVTDVPALLRGYGTPAEEEVRSLTPAEAEELLPELAAGSMRPKVEACLRFVRATGGEALIVSAAGLSDALEGKSGTRIASE